MQHWSRSFIGGFSAAALLCLRKDLITKNFTLRSVEYRASCFPHEVTLDGFSVKGQALRALPAAVAG